MEFQSSGQPLNDNGMDQVCDILKVSDAEIWAILTVETRGFGYYPDRRPQILFERHIFHRLTNGIHDAASDNLSNPLPGGYHGGAAEYERLAKAIELDRNNGLKSASWGIAQIMGFNHKAAGFSSVELMMEAMVHDENAQLLAMAKFIKNNNLAVTLQRRNWTSFARGYNGKDFKRNEYDTRLAAAYAKYRITLPDLTLRTAQAALIYLGINPGPVDGLRGRRTRAALIEFQDRFGLNVNGELDHETEAELIKQAFAQPT